MAADTAAKRFSALGFALPFRGINVVPDVAIPQGERQSALHYYFGISFTGAPVGPDEYTFYYHGRIKRSHDAIAKKKRKRR